MGIQAGMSQRGKSITSSVSPELFLLHSLACLQLLRKLARQVAFTFFESKDIFRELAMRAGRELDMGTAEVVRTHTAQDTHCGIGRSQPSQDRSILYPKLHHFLLQFRFPSLYIPLLDFKTTIDNKGFEAVA